MAEFHFDFNAVVGMSLAEGAEVLFKQMEDHYNENVNQPQAVVFGAPKAPKPTASATEDAPKKERPLVKTDTETVTPKTIAMKKFAVRGSADGESKLLVGEAEDGRQINDVLLPGYDEAPYGPVVSGENGRYNLNPKGK